MNRETNTIGSKANDVSMAQIVINIKSEIEKNPRTDSEYRVIYSISRSEVSDEAHQYRIWQYGRLSRLIAIVIRNPHRSSAPCRRPATAAWSWTAPMADAPAPCSSWTATMGCSVLCSRRPLWLVLRARPRKEKPEDA